MYRSNQESLLARIRALEAELASRPSQAALQLREDHIRNLLRERVELRRRLHKRDLIEASSVEGVDSSAAATLPFFIAFFVLLFLFARC
jgi:hypothetical protein